MISGSPLNRKEILTPLKKGTDHITIHKLQTAGSSNVAVDKSFIRG